MPTLKETFKKFATKAEGKEATSKDITRWFQDSGALGKENNSQNLDIAFTKVKTKGKSVITDAQMVQLIKEVAPKYAKDKKLAADVAVETLTNALADCDKKEHGTTGVSKTGGVGKMTDTSKYTGAHKERFDADGKGKGAEGRTDKADNSGYVGNYKGAGTYDKK